MMMVNKIQNLKQRFTCITFLILVLSLVLVLSLPEVSAGGQDATYDSVEVKAVPPLQGVGGEVHIEAVAKFFGGCCYHLYANDVKPELVYPANITITSALPKTVDKVDAVPGGSATTEKFRWTVISDTPGTFNITVEISTSNCGVKTSSCQITIIQAASVSNPTIFPSKPSVGEPIIFSTDALSGSTLIDVERTTLYIWSSSDDYSEVRILAEENKLFEITGDLEINKTQQDDADTNISTPYLGSGKEYPMSHVEFTDTWRVRVKDLNKEEIIYYWFKVETSDGKNITSFVYKKPIEDLEKKYQMLNTMIWGSFITMTVGVILILGISWGLLNRPAQKLGKTGLFVLGSYFFSKPKEGTRTNVSGLSIQRFRTFLFALFVIITIVLLIISIYLGLFQDLLIETGG